MLFKAYFSDIGGIHMTKKLTLALFLFLCFSSTVFAAVTYTYQGNTFNGFSVPPGSYNIADRVTGSFTVASALASNLPEGDISAQVLSYSFSDGVKTLNNNNSVICAINNYGFRVGTNASGNITIWGITLCTPVSQPNNPVDFILTVSGVNELTEDFGVSAGRCSELTGSVCTSVDISIAGATNGVVLDNKGTWTTQGEITSVPSMTEWGMIFFMLFAGAGSVYYLKRQQRI
jgi:hypothetical protein